MALPKIYINLVHTYSDRISKNLKLYITLISALFTSSLYILIKIISDNSVNLTIYIKSSFLFIPLLSFLLGYIAIKNLRIESVRVFRYVAMMKKVEDLLGLTIKQEKINSKLSMNFFNNNSYFLIDDYVTPFHSLCCIDGRELSF